MQSIDVVVLGGGPAGAATALALARQGFSVGVVERSTYDKARAGETLPPIIEKPLTLLGVWDQFICEEHLPSYGTASAWGAPHPYESDFIFDPHGHGWHVDRQRFDVMLARAAEAAGATLYQDARLVSSLQESAGHWRLKIRYQGESFELGARFMVDATGHASSFARRCGAKRITKDNLVGVVRFLPPASKEVNTSYTTLVEAVGEGWWYSAPLPDGRLSVAFMTDADLYAAGTRRSINFWQEQLHKAPHTLCRASSYYLDAPDFVLTASSARLDASAAKAGWQ